MHIRRKLDPLDEVTALKAFLEKIGGPSLHQCYRRRGSSAGW